MIRTKPLEHQSKIVRFCESKSYAGIFSDYGTGKTLCALMLTELKKYKTALIVSTVLSIDTTWCDEIRKHTNFRFCILQGTAKQKINMLTYALQRVYYPDRYEYHNNSGVVRPMLFLINYEGVKSIYRELMQVHFDVIVADESTKIKTFNTERTKALQEVGMSASNRYLMTGFPVTEALFELYSQIKFLDHGKTFGNSYYSFLNKYFVRQGPKIVIKKKSIKEILDAIAPFCIRITNESLKLPPKRYKSIDIEPTTQQKELLLSLENTFRLEYGSVKIDTQYIFALLEKSLEICDGFIRKIEKDPKTKKIISENIEYIETNKDEALVEILDEINIQKNKVVIWCAFLPSLFKVEKILKRVFEGDTHVLTLTGATSNANKVVQMFQKTSNCNILLCTQKKAAESVTLTASKYAIYYSNMWSNDLRLNSEARIRRKGSEIHNSILYIDLITKGTMERKVYECLRKKKNLIDELKQEFLTKMG